MIGMDRHTGRAVTDTAAHIRQSVEVILSTPIGTRVERRDFGSLLPALIDTPANDIGLLRAYSAAVIAIMTWEPRLVVSRITRAVDPTVPGRAVLTIAGITDAGGEVDLVVPISSARVSSIAPGRLESIINGEYGLQRITEDERPDALGGLL